jgi:AbrB family looped-hinge helix DNA binding protein
MLMVKPRKVDDLGRITIPSKQREQLGLTPGTPFVCDVEGHELIVKPVVDYCDKCGAPLTESDAA